MRLFQYLAFGLALSPAMIAGWLLIQPPRLSHTPPSDTLNSQAPPAWLQPKHMTPPTGQTPTGVLSLPDDRDAIDRGMKADAMQREGQPVVPLNTRRR